MKKIVLALAVIALALPSAFAQYGQASGASAKTANKNAENPPLKTIRGTISADGKTFTPDKGKDTWTLKNPEDVKGHEGHHVDLNAHVFKSSHELHVMKVDMVGDKK